MVLAVVDRGCGGDREGFVGQQAARHHRCLALELETRRLEVPALDRERRRDDERHHGERRHDGDEEHDPATHPLSIRYPDARTVVIGPVSPGGAPSLRRKALMWTSSVLVGPHQCSSQTSAISCSRVTTVSRVLASSQEEVELLGTEIDDLAPHRGAPGVGFDGELADADRDTPTGVDHTGRAGGEAEVARHPGEQFGQPERLGDVVDRTRPQAHDHVGFVRPRRQHHYRERRPARRERCAELDPVAVGQGEIEEHEPGGPLLDRRRGRRERGDVPARVALRLEGAQEALADQEVVLHHEHTVRRHVGGA